MSTATYQRVEQDQNFPSLYMSVRNQHTTAVQTYIPIGPVNGPPAMEVTVIPGERWILVRNHQRFAKLPKGEAAQLTAERIAQASDLLVI